MRTPQREASCCPAGASGRLHHRPGSLGERIVSNGQTQSQRLLLTLQLDLILDHQGLVLVVDLLGELGGDSVMGRRVLDHETLVALNTLQDGGFLDRPGANVGPVLIRLGVLLLGVGGGPP